MLAFHLRLDVPSSIWRMYWWNQYLYLRVALTFTLPTSICVATVEYNKAEEVFKTNKAEAAPLRFYCSSCGNRNSEFVFVDAKSGRCLLSLYSFPLPPPRRRHRCGLGSDLLVGVCRIQLGVGPLLLVPTPYLYTCSLFVVFYPAAALVEFSCRCCVWRGRRLHLQRYPGR